MRGLHPKPGRGGLAARPRPPKHAVKNGRRYRYYVSRRLAAGDDGVKCQRVDPAWRLPAREIERVVSEAVRSLLTDPAELARCAREAGVAQRSIPELLGNAGLRKGEPLEQVDRVDLGAERIKILINLRDLLPDEVQLHHTVPMTMRRRGVESRLVIEGDRAGSGAPGLDPALVKAIARGRQWFQNLVSGRAASLVEIAKAEGITESYVGRLIPLAFLAPDIVESVLAGNQPVHVTTELLTKRVDLPTDWEEQMSLLGFERAPAS